MGNYVSVFPPKYANNTKNEFLSTQDKIPPSPIFRPIIRRDLKNGNGKDGRKKIIT
jgi:hypothetical protein